MSDGEFYTQIYDKYYKFIYREVRKLLYSEVNDDITSCAQETLLKVWEKIKILKKHKNIAGWLIITAKNIVMNFNKQYQLRESNESDLDIIEYTADENDFTEKISGDSAAEKILAHLSLDERKLYDYKYVARYSNEEIGDILGINPNAAASRNKRLLKKLKEIYESQK